MKGRPRVQQLYEWQQAQGVVTTYSDADWAGCKQTRKSTTGGCITLGKHTIKGWSKTQALVALSSGESALYATLRTAAETLGIIAMTRDLGINLEGRVWGDASAALGMIHRKGLGRTRHIDVGYLWVQQVAAERRLAFEKILGRDNPADLFTKYLDQKTIDRHVEKLQGTYVNGRPSCAPQLHYISISWSEYDRTAWDTRESWRTIVEQETRQWLKAMKRKIR